MTWDSDAKAFDVITAKEDCSSYNVILYQRDQSGQTSVKTYWTFKTISERRLDL